MQLVPFWQKNCQITHKKSSKMAVATTFNLQNFRITYNEKTVCRPIKQR
jgi:hypothetical protein